MSKKMDIYSELDNFVEENEGQVTLTDVAKHFAEYGYNYAVEKACEWLESNAYLYVDDVDQLHESALIGDFRHIMVGTQPPRKEE